MNHPTRLLGTCLVLSLIIASSVFAGTGPGEYREEAIESAVLGQRLDLKILLPKGYEAGGERCRVVYYLDGHWDDTFVNEIMDRAMSSGWTGKVITVGIDTRGKDRIHYLTPTRRGPHLYFKAPIDRTGGAPLLLRCLREEVFPFVETNYAADPEGRTLIGHSLGGLFGLFTVLQPDPPFANVIASSPTLPWDDNVLLRLEAEFAESHTALPVNLYAAVGSEEEEPGDPMVSTLTDFMAQLTARGYEGLNAKFVINEDDDHVTNKYVTIVKGTRWVFKQAEPGEQARAPHP